MKKELVKKANQGLYAAAEKVGMAGELQRVQAEVVANGEGFQLIWEYELMEKEGFERPNAAVWARAERWVEAFEKKAVA